MDPGGRFYGVEARRARRADGGPSRLRRFALMAAGIGAVVLLAHLGTRKDEGARSFAEARRLLHAGRYEAAVAEYERAAGLDGTWTAEALEETGICLLYLAAYERAEAAYRKSIALDDSSGKAHLGLGIALQNLAREREALLSFQAALERGAPEFDARFGIGCAQMSLRELDAAEASLRRCVALDPRDPAPHVQLGRLVRDRGDYPEALRVLTHAISLDEASAHAWYERGVVREWSADPRGALVDYEPALALSPSFIEAQSAVARLRASRTSYPDR